jgi:hypothetical protein
MSDRIDEEIKKAVREAAGEPRGAVGQRALARMAAVRPSRGLSRRWVLIALTVVMAAVGGAWLLAVPGLTATGIIEEMMRAAAASDSAHMTESVWMEGETVTREQWVSSRGLAREMRVGEQVVQVELFGVDRTLLYVAADTGRAFVEESGGRLCTPERKAALLSEGLLGSAMLFALSDGSSRLLSEQLANEGDGRSTRIVEIQWRPPRGTTGVFALNNKGLIYNHGETILIHVVADAETRRPTRVEHFRLVNGTREPTYQADIEWDIAVPQDVWQFTPPEDTRVERSIDWAIMAKQELVRGQTRDWTVVLHAIEVAANGDVHLAISRAETGANVIASSAPPIRVSALGSDGERYHQTDRGPFFGAPGLARAVVTLEPENRGATPRSITLTVTPYPADPSEDQSVTFRNLPLPPRQDVDDLLATETEVIQY